MIKKITSVLICIIIAAMTLPLTVSAADSASFRVRLAEQTDKTATVFVEFTDGTGFCALDFEVKYNSLKLKLTEAKLGSGYKLFRDAQEEKGSQIIGSINPDSNPIKLSVATLEPFAKVNNDGILMRMAFSKIGGTKVSESDVTLSVTNCQTKDMKDITASVSYDMDSAVSGDSEQPNQTAYAQRTSKDNMNDDDNTSAEKDSEIGEPVTATDSQGNVITVQNAEENPAADSNSEPSSAQDSSSNAKITSNKTKTIAIVAVAVILAAGIAVLLYIIIRNKKKQETEF